MRAGNPVLGGSVLRRPAIISPAYVPGESGWAVFADGTAEFNGITVRGTFSGTDWEINSAGTFFYSGPPARGNLVMSQAGSGGTDGYGNAYRAGTWVYDGGTAAGLVPAGGQAQLHLVPAGTAHSTEDALAYAGASGAGGAGESQYLIVTSGTSGGGDDAGLVLTGESADKAVPAAAWVSLGGTVPMEWGKEGTTALLPITAGSQWERMTLLNGWTVSPTGFAQYRLYPDNTVRVRFGGLQPGSAADGTELWAPPAGLVPAFTGTMSFPAVVTYSTAPPGVASTPEVVLKGGGGMQCFNLRGTVASIAGVLCYPLD